jgi:hypothetical protein
LSSKVRKIAKGTSIIRVLHWGKQENEIVQYLAGMDPAAKDLSVSSLMFVKHSLIYYYHQCCWLVWDWIISPTIPQPNYVSALFSV